ncbi:hypothetical protein GN244_ATG15361 [Phytophthora infestans]|uniref:Uncharacterized protein n=1 Tax=Phytophthora infestans TaxID=4787 RepID=A0A833RTC8_PHYIN|nr:hypothetical protein GN244_ATG15361 [Phytophthora infestans]KAF4139036.1 hypothetical protein GN958_ATG11766 [Phytophthora infestans]
MESLVPFLLAIHGDPLLAYLIANDHLKLLVIPDIRFDHASLTDAKAELEFRFDVLDVRGLAHQLGLREIVITANRDRA